MKLLTRILIIFGILIAVIAVGVFVLYNNMQKTASTYNKFDFASLDLSNVQDGTYTGSEDGGIVKASVEVTVKDHVITNVKILSHECGKGKPAEVIVNDIVNNNSLEVDTVSGATYSSNVIKVAVYNALTQ
ncbi:MAG TPA: FMN-binding protein [Mobilitalea sp.]|nr:FMN-binding protein [Mobilitalea sp.]